MFYSEFGFINCYNQFYYYYINEVHCGSNEYLHNCTYRYEYKVFCMIDFISNLLTEYVSVTDLKKKKKKNGWKGAGNNHLSKDFLISSGRVMEPSEM